MRASFLIGKLTTVGKASQLAKCPHLRHTYVFIGKVKTKILFGMDNLLYVPGNFTVTPSHYFILPVFTKVRYKIYTDEY